MKRYKALTIGIILAVLPFNSASAIGGFGIQGGQSLFSVGETTKKDLVTSSNLYTAAFENSLNIGVYVYLDIIPFIDLEVDAIFSGQKYDFSFDNLLGDKGPFPAPWGGASIYFTARRKIVGFELPILGGAQLFAGGGYNTHSFAPLVDFSLVESLMGGDLSADPEFSEDDFIDFVKENKIDKTGFHIQGGLKFQLMMLDAFLFYRQTFGDFEDVLDAKTIGGLNFRVGMAI